MSWNHPMLKSRSISCPNSLLERAEKRHNRIPPAPVLTMAVGQNFVPAWVAESRAVSVSFNVKLHLWVSDVKAAAGGEGQKYNNTLPSGQNSEQFLWNRIQSSPLAVCTSVLFSMTISMTVSMWKHWDDTMWKSSGVVQGLTRQQSKSRNGWVGGLSRCSFFLDQKFHSSSFSTRGFTNSAVLALWRFGVILRHFWHLFQILITWCSTS